MRLRLHSTVPAAKDIAILELAAVDATPLPGVTPGAHLSLRLPDGLCRQYSLLDPNPAPRRYRIAVKKEARSRGGSRYLHEGLTVGAELSAEAPRNGFELRPHEGHTVLVAGGIGITPIYGMVQALRALGASYELHYGGRSEHEAAFARELAADQCARLYFSRAGRRMDLQQIVSAAPVGAHFYCCGPAAMLVDYRKATEHLPPDEVHAESFSADSALGVDRAFTVVLARSGAELTVERGSTILATLLAAGVAVEYSCEQGLCGACETKVLAGEPDHRDSLLSTEERARSATMMICCSGSRGARLVLDL
jgi:tetrachlorobenzoquinone reductase